MNQVIVSIGLSPPSGGAITDRVKGPRGSPPWFHPLEGWWNNKSQAYVKEKKKNKLIQSLGVSTLSLVEWIYFLYGQNGKCLCAVLIMDIEEGCKMMSHMAWTFISSSEMGPNAEICYHGYEVGRLLLRWPITIICKRKLCHCGVSVSLFC